MGRNGQPPSKTGDAPPLADSPQEVDSRIAAALGPRVKAVKEMEMTVRRCLKIMEAFDTLDRKDADWSAIEPAVLRAAFGDYNPVGQQLPELWKRYKDKTLHRQVLELADNLVMENLQPKVRKEVERGINRVRKALDS